MLAGCFEMTGGVRGEGEGADRWSSLHMFFSSITGSYQLGAGQND